MLMMPEIQQFAISNFRMRIATESALDGRLRLRAPSAPERRQGQRNGPTSGRIAGSLRLRAPSHPESGETAGNADTAPNFVCGTSGRKSGTRAGQKRDRKAGHFQDRLRDTRRGAVRGPAAASARAGTFAPGPAGRTTKRHHVRRVCGASPGTGTFPAGNERHTIKRGTLTGSGVSVMTYETARRKSDGESEPRRHFGEPDAGRGFRR